MRNAHNLSDYTQNKPVNINEFFGFNLETRIRELVTDCMEPLKLHHELTINRVKGAEEKIKRNVQQIGELNFILQKTLQRSSSMEEVHQQILLMENERKVSESELIKEVNTSKQLLRQTQEKVQQVDEVIKSDRRLHEMFKKDLTHMRNDINQFKDKFSDDHIKFKLDFQNKQDKFMFEVQKVQEQMNLNGVRIGNHIEILQQHETIINTYKNNFEELYETIADLNDKKMGKNTYEAELTQIRRDLKNLKLTNEDTYNSLQMTDNYLDRYLKIDILNEVVEGLFCTINDSEVIEKLIDYSKLRYFDLKRKIDELENKQNPSKIETQQLQQPVKKVGAALISSMNLQNHTQPSQNPEKRAIQSNFNKVGYKIPQFEKIEQKESISSTPNPKFNVSQQPAIVMKYSMFNGLNNKDKPIERSAKEFDKFKKKIMQTQKVLASFASPSGLKKAFSRKSSQLMREEQQQKREASETINEEFFEDLQQEQFVDGGDDQHLIDDPNLDNDANTLFKGTSLSILNQQFPDPLKSPRTPSRLRKMFTNKRPAFKKIIVNSTSSAQVQEIRELKSFNEKINTELVKQDGKHQTHQEKISVLEDLDDELKEIVLQSSEQIEDIYKKIGDLHLKCEKLSAQIESEDSRIMQYVEEQINQQNERISNVQLDIEEDLKRRIREKSNFDLALKRLEGEIFSLKDKETRNEETVGIIMENMRILVQTSRALCQLTKQDEIDKSAMQLLGLKMNSNVEGTASNITARQNSQQPTNKQVRKNNPIINSVLTGISHDNSQDDLLNGGMSMQSIGSNNTNPIKSVISIDRNCLSCSGQQSVVMNAFKVACLQYQPQKVLFNNEVHERKNLIDKCIQNLEQLNNSTFMKSLNQTQQQQHQYVQIQMPLVQENLSQFGSHITHNIREEDSQQAIVKIDKWTTQNDDDNYQNLNRSKSSTTQSPRNQTQKISPRRNNNALIDKFTNKLDSRNSKKKDGNQALSKLTKNLAIDEFISNRNLPELKAKNDYNSTQLFKTLAQPKTARQLSRNLILPSFGNLTNREGITSQGGDSLQSKSTNLLTFNQGSSQYRKKKNAKNAVDFSNLGLKNKNTHLQSINNHTDSNTSPSQTTRTHQAPLQRAVTVQQSKNQTLLQAYTSQVHIYNNESSSFFNTQNVNKLQTLSNSDQKYYHPMSNVALISTINNKKDVQTNTGIQAQNLQVQQQSPQNTSKNNLKRAQTVNVSQQRQ
eukprot:403377108